MEKPIELDSTAKKTLHALGSALRTEKFILRATIKKKKEFEFKEGESREKIRNLTDRVRWELDYHIVKNRSDKSLDSDSNLES